MRISHAIAGGAVMVIATTAVAAKDLTTVLVALDQVGYLAGDHKIALVETNRDLIGAGAVARVLVQPGATPALPDIPIAVDRSAPTPPARRPPRSRWAARNGPPTTRRSPRSA